MNTAIAFLIVIGVVWVVFGALFAIGYRSHPTDFKELGGWSRTAIMAIVLWPIVLIRYEIRQAVARWGANR